MYKNPCEILNRAGWLLVQDYKLGTIRMRIWKDPVLNEESSDPTEQWNDCLPQARAILVQRMRNHAAKKKVEYARRLAS